jgi:formylglycine-generating enzyme required for sulfatase activity
MFNNKLVLLVMVSLFYVNEVLSQNISLVKIPTGTFQMGEPETEYLGPPNSYDATEHTVTLSDFWMGETEITNQQYVDFLNLAYGAGLLVVGTETSHGPDNGKKLVYGSDTAPDDYRNLAIINLDGTRVMKDHDNDGGSGDGNPFTGIIEPENPLNICYIGFDENTSEGEKFYVKNPATDFDWMELTNYYNYTEVPYELDTTVLLNDYENWDELKDLPTLEEVKNWPASFIRWYGAKAFAMFYNLDLPTEAQWEYAASGGNKFKYATADGNVNGDGTSANWNFAHEEPALHHVYDVKFNNPNPFGLYNMAGNVWEWCEDWYASDFYEDGTNPVNTTDSGVKVRRGGSWNYHESTLKSAARAKDEKFKGNDHFGFRVVSNVEITSSEKQTGITPNQFELFNNYPNPFNPSTTIKFNLPEQQKVMLKIFNILGAEVKTLVNETVGSGSYSYKWNGKNDYGNFVSTGLYIYTLRTEKYTKSKKMLLIK